MNQALLLYHFAEGYAERDRVKGQLRPEDREYSRKVKDCCLQQRSSIFVEAAPLIQEMGLCGLAQGKAEEQFGLRGSGTTGAALMVKNTTIFELRRYQLKLGYDTVPKFLDLYGSGLPSKLQAPGTDPTTSLLTVLYSDVGQLNQVMEIWRHGNGTEAMEASRVAARGASEWRTAIGEIAGIANVFTTSIFRPYPFSNIR
jgi:hypothetical protein